MIKGIGIDVVDVVRMEKALRNPRFLQRVFTALERSEAGERGTEHFAGLFAAKEAVVKALGTGFNGVGFHDVEIARGALGQPLVRLHGAPGDAAARDGLSVLVSITHERHSVAAAVAIIEG